MPKPQQSPNQHHHRWSPPKRSLSLPAFLIALAIASPAGAGQSPEDILKGKIIISTTSLPVKWTSAAAYTSQLKKMHKSSVTYDTKTGKIQVYYAAFFAKPVNELKVNFVAYDVTDGNSRKVKKGAWEAFLGRKGERVLFNSIELDKEDFGINKKYLFAIEFQGKVIAQTDITLRGEAPKYSGKVEFTEEDKKK